MNTLRLGQIIDANAKRDAVHVAIAPAVAGHMLRPGEPVSISSEDEAVAVPPAQSIGIVDPFLGQNVTKGQYFWLWLKPGSITALRHDWDHPAFRPEMKQAGSATMRLADFANELGLTYEAMMKAAKAYADNGDYLVQHSFEGMGIPKGFWADYNAVTGSEVEEDEGAFFSCGGCS